MSTTDDTVPAAETDSAEFKPFADVLAERHQAQPAHEPHREVGESAEEPDPAPAAAAPAAPAAPAAAAAAPVAPAAAPAAPAAETPPVDPATKPENEQPFWYRKEIKREREARQAAERQLAQLRGGPPPNAAAPAGPSDEDLDRPLTRRELMMEQERSALIGRLERSEDRLVDKHGEDTFESVREWLATRPDIEEWALKQRDPWAAAHSQFNKERLASEIGEDPNAWREAERERIRAEILAEQTPGGPRPPQAPAAAPQMRSAPPAPASQARSAAPRDESGRFTGPAPLKTRNNFA